MPEEIIQVYTKKDEINKILELIKKHNKAVRTTHHFEERIFLRGYPRKIFFEIFPQFEKIRIIRKRKLKKDFGYDLIYEIGNNKHLVLTVCLTDKIEFINGFLRDRRIDRRIRKLKI